MKKSVDRTYAILLAISVVMIITGIVLRVVGFDHKILDLLVSGGGGAATVCVVSLISRKRNPERTKQAEIDMKDERSVQIRGKAFGGTWYVTLITLAVLVVYFTYTEQLIAFALSMSAFIIHMISFSIIKAYYSKKM